MRRGGAREVREQHAGEHRRGVVQVHQEGQPVQGLEARGADAAA